MSLYIIKCEDNPLQDTKLQANSQYNDTPSPISNIVFRDISDSDRIIINLNRSINIANLNLMKKSKKGGEDSYVIYKDLTSEMSQIDRSTKIYISKEYIEKDSKNVYSFQLVEAMTGKYWTSEAFKYDKNEKEFKLLREFDDDDDSWKSSYTLYIILGVILAIIIIGLIIYFIRR
ncbi:hypothetical protein TCON_0194 [Astathelohania contejeani]|uniref:Uncharacterized protein n=1 Tax=Astathelohania contejeani TaxID=164912 RepID=A0ABQ7I2B2_9MICR|nr:hypothetical protein TCON_0194 [Thelohania contejeani]